MRKSPPDAPTNAVYSSHSTHRISVPGLIYGGVHGRDGQKVFQELCEVVERAIKEMEETGMPLPPDTPDKDYSGKLALRISPDLHRKIAIKAHQTGESINKFVQTTLEKME